MRETLMRRRAIMFPVAILLLVPLLNAVQAGATPPTNGAVVPIPPQRTGVIVPLYNSSSSAWTPVTDAKAAHPNVPIVVIVNPADGPGSAPIAAYVTLVGHLRSAGVVVLGYSYTSYGSRSASEVESEINSYAKWYNVSGVFLDQMAYHTGEEGYFGNLTAYARSLGLSPVVGNPGVDVAPSYAGTVDTIVIYENSGFPFPSTLGGWHTGYAKTNWAVIAYNVGSLNQACAVSASNYAGYVYTTDGTNPTPWKSLPPYFGDLVATLDSQPPQECLAITAGWPNRTPITGMWATVQSGGGAFVTAGFTPLLFAAAPGTQYGVSVPNYRTYLFDYWADTGSHTRVKMVSLSSDTIVTAIFANSSGPPPPGESKISVTALNSAGANLNGMYVSFWSNASVLPGCSSPCSSSQGLLFSCYSPCTAFVTNGAVYYVAVADYGGETFTHWSDGTPDRFYKLMVGNTSTVIGLSATFSP